MTNQIKKASIKLLKQPVKVKTRKLKSNFSLDIQEDMTSLHSGSSWMGDDKFISWLVNYKKISLENFTSEYSEEDKKKMYKKFQIWNTYAEEDAVKLPRTSWFEEMFAKSLTEEMTEAIDREIIEQCKAKCKKDDKLKGVPNEVIDSMSTHIKDLFEQEYIPLTKANDEILKHSSTCLSG